MCVNRVRPVFLPPSQAVDYYLKALRSLGTRDIHPAVWDSVNWELSTTYFTMATLQQDYAPLSRKAQEQVRVCGAGKKPPASRAALTAELLLLDRLLNVLYTRLQACLFSFFVLSFSLMKNKQIEKEVSEAMMKSLKHCDVDAVSARQPLCQYRAATIHHRLASMYHSCLRNQVRRSGAGAPPRPFARVLAASPTSQCAFQCDLFS